MRRQQQYKKRIGRYTMALYKQAGNSIAVPIFESIFRKIILRETEEVTNGTMRSTGVQITRTETPHSI